MLKKLVVAVACMLPLSMMAQKEFKFGHVNTQEIFTTMPEYEEMRTQVNKLADELENQLDKMMQEYTKKMEEYQNSAATMNEAVKKDKETDIINLQQRIENFRQSAAENLQTKQQDLIAAITTKVSNAVKAVGVENGFTYIFNVGGDVLYASDQSIDVTSLVKKKLNEKAPTPVKK